MNGITIERTVIRPTPTADAIGNIPANTPITFDVDLGSWLRLTSVNGAQRAGYVNARSVKITPAPPPPPPPPAGKTITNIITVYDDGSISIASK